ncbi:MAG: leucine-rich repeat protein [Lachnospiraceae bacterium]|nr:leucine-rich repeat protein [Lachnospiraceae bacterium]
MKNEEYSAGALLLRQIGGISDRHIEEALTYEPVVPLWKTVLKWGGIAAAFLLILADAVIVGPLLASHHGGDETTADETESEPIFESEPGTEPETVPETESETDPVPETVLIESDGTYRYTLASDGNSYELFGGTGVNGDTVTLPSSFRGLPVTAIRTTVPGSRLFEGETVPRTEHIDWTEFSVRKLVIPEGYTSLDAVCLRGIVGLEEIVLPDSVTEIPGQFLPNAALFLKKITFGKNLIRIGAEAFSGCTGLNEVVFPSSLREIGDFAFQNTGLTSVVFPKLEKCGRDVFANCLSLTEVSIADGVTEIPSETFLCTPLTEVTFPKGLQRIGDRAFEATGLTSLSLPDSVTEIGTTAFSGCRFLTSADFGKGLTTIKSQAFQNCSSLTFAPLPLSIRSVGDFAFCGTALTSVKVPEGTSLSNGVYANAMVETAVLPESLTVIPPYLFQYCPLTSLIFSSNLTRIGDCAFMSTRLTSFDFPESITQIGTAAFEYCRLTEVRLSIRESVSNLAFAENPLTAVYLDCGPETYFGSGVFANCGKLRVGFGKTLPSSGDLNEMFRFRAPAEPGTTEITEITVDPENKQFRVKNGRLYENGSLYWDPAEK